MDHFPAFSEAAPSEECEAFFGKALEKDVYFVHGITVLGYDDAAPIESHFFGAIVLYLSTGGFAVTACKARCVARCSRSNVTRAMRSFSTSVLTVSPVCQICSRESAEIVNGAIISILDMDLLSGDGMEMEVTFDIIREKYEVAIGMAVTVEAHIISTKYTLPLSRSTTYKMLWENAHRRFLNTLSNIEPNKYVRNGGGSNGDRKVYRCNQRSMRCMTEAECIALSTCGSPSVYIIAMDL